MSSDCCKLVGNLSVGEGVISVQVRSNTEVNKSGNSIIVGPTIGSISLSAFASRSIHIGCPGRAGVSINWIRRYDCDNDVVHFLFSGAGRSYISGDAGGFVRLTNSVVSYPVLNASAASGPAALYEDSSQVDGYGLSYTGAPFPFDTDSEGGLIFSNIGNIGTGTIYLQSFSLQCNPGELPTVNYDLVFVNNNI